jgi:hypothetical protein
MGEFYVYCHRRNDDGTCFYIGKGKRERYKETKSRNKHWNNVVKKAGGFTPIILVNNLSEDRAFMLEKKFISQIGIKNLVNIAEGGTGGNVFENMPEDMLKRIRCKMSESAKNRERLPISQEHKKRISESKRGVKRQPLSSETKDKISEKLKGHIFSDDTKTKLSKMRSIGNTGKKWYTDGLTNYFRIAGTEPEGSYLGRTKKL